jgi:hypothetical protein
MMQVSAVGLPWYKREDFDALRSWFTDGGKFPKTYDEWLRAAEMRESQLRANGTRVVRALIEPEPFNRWCANQGIVPDSKARSRYASEYADRTVQAKGRSG